MFATETLNLLFAITYPLLVGGKFYDVRLLLVTHVADVNYWTHFLNYNSHFHNDMTLTLFQVGYSGGGLFQVGQGKVALHL